MKQIRNRLRPSGPTNMVNLLTVRPVVTVRLFTAHSQLSGSLRLDYNRLSDHLNFGPTILELTQVSLEVNSEPTSTRTQTSAFIRKESILVAADQLSDDYMASHPSLREPKDAFAMTADFGHFAVAGTLHVMHGSDLATWLTEGPLFVPLTNATIYGHGAPRSEPNLVINRQAVMAILR